MCCFHLWRHFSVTMKGQDQQLFKIWKHIFVFVWSVVIQFVNETALQVNCLPVIYYVCILRLPQQQLPWVRSPVVKLGQAYSSEGTPASCPSLIFTRFSPVFTCFSPVFFTCFFHLYFLPNNHTLQRQVMGIFPHLTPATQPFSEESWLDLLEWKQT